MLTEERGAASLRQFPDLKFAICGTKEHVIGIYGESAPGKRINTTVCDRQVDEFLSIVRCPLCSHSIILPPVPDSYP